MTRAAGTPPAARRAIGPPRRARHLVTENARVRAVVGALEQDRIEDVGPLFEQSHASLRDDFEVSARELDCCVDAAREVGR